MANNYGGLIWEVVYPFGRGALTSTGNQYSTTISTATTADAFITVESATIPLPTNAIIQELGVGLTMGGSLVTSTAAIEIRYRIANSGNAASSNYDALLTSTSLLSVVSTGALTDIVYSGVYPVSTGTYFTGKGSFVVVGSVGCGSTTKAAGAMKNASYVYYTYYLVG